MDDYRKLLDKNLYHEFGYTNNRKGGSSNEFIKKALNNLRLEDEMLVYNTLCELCSELSMANDNLADDVNCQTLIKELIILLDKFYMLPDVGVTSLNCINYLLDINPRYTSVITKWNGISKIIKMTQNFEYFECAETVIKSIEKMSHENPYIMIENDAFGSLLSLMEFCDLGLRKIALKACVNMTNCINNQDFIKKFIMPSIPSLSNLIRYSGDSELEKVLLDLSVQCFYNIIISIKNYNLNTNMTSFYKLVSDNGILENLYDVFLRFLKIDKESVYDDEMLIKRKNSSYIGNSSSNTNSNSNSNINLETFKNIIKIFEYFCFLNADITNGILNMNILNVIYFILVKEFGLISSNTYKKLQSQDATNNDLKLSLSELSQEKVSKVGSNSQGYFIEIFNLLISLFPNKNSKGAADRLLAQENKNFFIYFSEKILCLIINNVVNIPSSNSMVQIFKLLEMYIQSSSPENIFTYIDPIKFSNIANKMLDSKDSSYIMQVFSVVEIVMNKIPTHFLVSFLREGVIDSIKNLMSAEDNNIYVPNDPQGFLRDFSNISNNLNYNNLDMNIAEDEFLDENEIINQESNYFIKDKMENLKSIRNIFKAKENKIDLINNKNKDEPKNELFEKPNIKNAENKITEINNINEHKNKFIDKYNDTIDNEMIIDDNFPIIPSNQDLVDMDIDEQNFKINKINEKMLSNKIYSSNIFSKEYQNLIKSNELNIVPKTEIFEEKIYKNNKIPQKQDSINNINTSQTNNINLPNVSIEPIILNKNNRPRTKSYNSSGILTGIKTKANELTDKFFNEENIDNLLNKANVKKNPREKIKKLLNLKEILKKPDGVDTETILSLLSENLFFDENDMPTFYEIEKSEVILSLTHFLDENFLINLENSNEGDTKTICYLNDKYNFDIIKKLKLILKALDNDLNKVNAFISTLQNCISSMNCFKLYIYDVGNIRQSSNYFFSNLKNNSQKLRVKFNYGFSNNFSESEYNDLPTINKILGIYLTSEANDNNEKIKNVCNILKSPNLITENDMKILNEIHEFYKEIKAYPINVELNENLSLVKENILKLKNKKNNHANIINNPLYMLNQNANSNKFDFYEEILSQISNNKGTEEELTLRDKLMQKVNDRKNSIDPKHKKSETSEDNSEKLENLSEKEILVNKEKIENNLKSLDDKLEFIFYALIKDELIVIKDSTCLMDFFKEIKKRIKKADYNIYATDVQIYFDIYLKNPYTLTSFSFKKSSTSMNNIFHNIGEDKINPVWSFSNISTDLEIYEKIKLFNSYKESKNNKILNIKNQDNSKETIIIDNYKIIDKKLNDNLENVLFEKYYYENILNNPGLYCIKRAAPFVYLISLLELAINNYKNIFEVENKDEDIGLRPATIEILSKKNLENLKVTSLLFKQIKDPFAVSNSCIPSWCRDLIHNFTYLSGFNSRYLLFKITSFDIKRALGNLYNYLKNFLGENITDDKYLGSIKRHKYKIDRSKILTDATGFIEYEYNDETGTGLGPTLEFYSLCFKEIINNKDLWYKTSNNTLFPSPILKKEDLVEKEKIFNLLGFLVARALYDDRLIDIPINSLFWDLVLDRAVSYDKINYFDKDLGNAYTDFLKLLKEKKKLLEKHKDISETQLNEIILYNGMKIEDIGLTFNIPGYNDYELKNRGNEILVTINNLEEYLELVFDKLILTGIDPLIRAFKMGFNKVFKIESLKCFTNKELEEIICGCDDEAWDYDNLMENIIPDHGFDKNSLMYKGLLQIMIKMNNLERKTFLQFVTGSPRLPIGGFKNLSPKLSVVMKKLVNESENPNDFLPTVMTCQKNMKIPNYSNVEILNERLFLAMYEGNNAFHLS